ncbi:MAG TPA: aminotransferase class III-fold pyridoxal phosphate-dependent enzyme, partial [Phenylobacterium sp.]|nr:aminotransferase class III-fold pyridoxal phosphate-dependent enzyme [Phenylobacterium sp.]
RGKGLFFGVELVEPETGRPATEAAGRIVNRMYEEGVLISRIGPHNNTLKMRPPMPITGAEADVVIDRLDAILGEMS